MADNMTRAQRSRTMSRIRKTNTQPELAVRRLCFARGLRYRKYVASLPGKPDMVFPGPKVVVFIDGDFWHGWQFHRWDHKLSSTYWKDKIRGNMERDRRNCASLRKAGWKVVRIWEHEVEKDLEACVDKVEIAVRGTTRSRGSRST